jgi:hypothetical protein
VGVGHWEPRTGWGEAGPYAPHPDIDPAPCLPFSSGPDRAARADATGSSVTTWFIGPGRPRHEPSQDMPWLGRAKKLGLVPGDWASGCMLMYTGTIWALGMIRQQFQTQRPPWVLRHIWQRSGARDRPAAASRPPGWLVELELCLR